ncbi:beta-ketoacyl synthase, partial [Streptomyces sp. SID8382]
MTMNPDGVTVTAHALHVPDPIGGSVATAAGDLFSSVAPEPACGPDRAHTVLGRKGLLFKEDATRLALCAVHRAFGLPPGKLTEPLPGAEHTAVVVSSNVGNARTVRDIVAGMRAGSAHDVSPLNGPNASSNVIASTLAIRYGFTGPNLMVCSGATSGLDAVRLGALLLRGERARRVVVVGAEPDDEVARGLAALRPAAPGTTLPV